MQIALVITVQNQLRSPQSRGEVLYLRLLNWDQPHLHAMVSRWWSRLWVLDSHGIFHAGLCLDLKQVAFWRTGLGAALLWLEPFRGPSFEVKTKLFNPLFKVTLLLSLFPPPLASPHIEQLLVPTSGPLHSCSLHLQCSSFLPPPGLSLNVTFSEKPRCTPQPINVFPFILFHGAYVFCYGMYHNV